MLGGIVIVTHNNLHLTKRAVHTALHQTVPCFVLVIDNQSTDNTVRWLSSRRREALDEGSRSMMVMVPQSPLSLAACWNHGLRCLFKAGIDKVLMLNNDVEIRPDSYETLARYMDWSSDFEGLVSMLGVSSREEMLRPRSPINLVDLFVERIPHPDFAGFMIEQGTFEKVGPFDEDYAVFCEDCDFHVRMHREQVKASKIPLPFLHHHSQTLATASEEERAYIHRMAGQSRKRFEFKYGCLPGTAEYDRLFQ